MSILILENGENWVQKKWSYIKFSIKCHDCPQKIPYIIHLIDQHWIYQNFPCRYGCILQEKEKINIFLEVFWVYL